MSGRNRKFAGWFVACSCLMVGIMGCAPTRYVTVEKITIEQEETQKGTITKVTKVQERADRNVIENSTNVKSVTRITDFKGKKEFGRFDVNPDGEKLLIPIIESVGNDAFAQIWTLGTNGMGMTKVTTGKYKDLDPVYSPDAKHIYFSSNRGEEKPKIWRVFATGTGGLTRVTSSSTSDRTPCIAPSGQNLAYTALMPGTSEWQIWTVNANGALPTQLIVGVEPVYSPDGKKILYTRDNPDTKKEDIWTMNTDGSSRTQMTSGDANCTSPRWSPDGSKIVFASDKGLDEEKKHNFDIWLMSADGTNVTQLTTNGSYDDFPVFDPNGKYIYFRSNRGGSWDIWRMELATETLQQ